MLEKAGFLKSLKLEHSPLKVYRATAIGRHLGAQVAQSPIPMTDFSSSIAIHQLELNEIRLALELNGLKNWRSAESLIVDPGFKKLGGKACAGRFLCFLGGS